jgi:hypothetical protein
MLVFVELDADFSRGCAGKRIGQFHFATLPYRYMTFEFLRAAQQCPKM